MQYLSINWHLLWHDLARRAERGDFAWFRHWSRLRIAQALLFGLYILWGAFSLANGDYGLFLPYLIYITAIIWCFDFGEGVNGESFVERVWDRAAGDVADVSVLSHGGPWGLIFFLFATEAAAWARRAMRPMGLFFILVMAGFLTPRDGYAIALFCTVAALSWIGMSMAVGMWGKTSAWSRMAPLLVFAPILLLTTKVWGSAGIVWTGWIALVNSMTAFVVTLFTPGAWVGHEAGLVATLLICCTVGIVSSYILMRMRWRGLGFHLRRRTMRPGGRREVKAHGLATAAIRGMSPLDHPIVRGFVSLILVPVALVPFYGPMMMLSAVYGGTVGHVLHVRAQGRWDDLFLCSTDNRALARALAGAVIRHNLILLPGLLTVVTFGNVTAGFVPGFNLVGLAQVLFAEWHWSFALVATALVAILAVAGSVLVVVFVTVVPLEDAVRISAIKEIQSWRANSFLMFLGFLPYVIWILAVAGHASVLPPGTTLSPGDFFGAFLGLLLPSMTFGAILLAMSFGRFEKTLLLHQSDDRPQPSDLRWYAWASKSAKATERAAG